MYREERIADLETWCPSGMREAFWKVSLGQTFPEMHPTQIDNETL